MITQNARNAAEIVIAAGGQIVGRTRLQKVAYLLGVAGLRPRMSFCYKHYGPYSEELATGARDAGLLGLLQETEKSTEWGGTYSIYIVDPQGEFATQNATIPFASAAAAANAVELELAATAVYLKEEGVEDPWTETERRKPEKAEGGRLDKAKKLYSTLRLISTPASLPDI